MAERRRGIGVRARVTALATTLVLVVLVATGLATSARHHGLLLEALEEQAESGAEDLAGALAAGRAPSPVAGFGDDDAAFQVVDAGGRVVAASANLDGEPPLLATPTAGRVVRRTVDDLPHDDARFLVLSQVVDTPDGPVALHVAVTLDDVEESTDALRATLALVVPAAGSALAVALWFVVGRALRPVERIRAEVAHIGGTDLHRRVPEPAGDDEVALLARTMNQMLGRVEAARDRQLRFVADASHELRSPLTRMRTELEVDRDHPERADVAATSASVLDEVLGMQRLVEDLLHVARDDAASPTPGEPVRVDVVVTRAAADLRAATGLAVDTTHVTAVVVAGRPDALRRLVANLLDNAGRHARTSVDVSLVEVGRAAVLVVADDGPGIAPADRERVFQRFTRLDDARTAATGGAGLGLAIVRDVAAQHGGTVVLDDAPGGGARFVVTLPLA
jgi:signal transduction histidine kinase